MKRISRFVCYLISLLMFVMGKGTQAQALRSAAENRSKSRFAASPCRNHPFLWSRQAQQDRQGYYYQPTGLCEDYPVEARTVANLNRDFQVLRATGARLLRVGIGWDTIEEEAGKQNWTFWDQLVATAVRNHIALLPYVCYTPRRFAQVEDDFWREPPRDNREFGRFMEEIARRYRGKVHSWELWNEPDNADYWRGTPEQYAQMALAGAEGVHRGDPSATVVLGGLAHGDPAYLKQLLTTEKLREQVDVINFHGYSETWDNYRGESYPWRIFALQSEIRADGNGQDLWMAEFGYSNYRSSPSVVSEGTDAFYTYEHTPAYQATTLFKDHILALSTGALSLTAWYRINDLKPAQEVIGDENNKFLGVVDRQGKPKPAFFALQFYNRLFHQPVRCLDNEIHITAPAASQSVVHAFERRDGTLLLVGWLRGSDRQDIPVPTGLAEDKRQEEIAIALPGNHSAHLIAYDVVGKPLPSTALYIDHHLTHVQLMGEHLFIATLRK